MPIDDELNQKLYSGKPEGTSFPKILTQSPFSVPPIVTRQDFNDGFLMRYFIRSVTDSTYILEIDNTQFENFKENPRFVVTSLRWKIVGKKETQINSMGIKNIGVKDYNILETSKTDLTFGGLKRYITDYLQFWLAETI
jgi:hypothetical protein